MLFLHTTKKYRKDRNLCKKRGLKIELLDEIIQTLREQKPLAPKHRDHELTGDYNGFRECHIQSDWLLIYLIDGKKLILTASRTGTHSDLF
ncbi:MAG: type II toxin-antitoxin system YafQ family toxin [Oscillospiraceae bacterium]|nr:type II toxin-antitoxin system YafQ family toxin [Oscillospiraceae bacterium]